MSTDLKFMEANNPKGDVSTVFGNYHYGMTLSTHVGGYASFVDLVSATPHAIVAENPELDELCFNSYVFKKKDLEEHLCEVKNEKFQEYFREDLKQINTEFVFIQLI